MSDYYEEHEEAVYAAQAAVRIVRKALEAAKMVYLKAKEDMLLVKPFFEQGKQSVGPTLGSSYREIEK